MHIGPRSILLVALAAVPVALPAQRLPSQHALRSQHDRFIAPPSPTLGLLHTDARPSRGPYVLGGALLGGGLAAVTVGPALVRAEIGSEPLVYAATAAGGALIGAFIGLIVYEARHGS